MCIVMCIACVVKQPYLIAVEAINYGVIHRNLWVSGDELGIT